MADEMSFLPVDKTAFEIYNQMMICKLKLKIDNFFRPGSDEI